MQRRSFIASILATGTAPALMLHVPAMRLWTPALVLPVYDEWLMVNGVKVPLRYASYQR